MERRKSLVLGTIAAALLVFSAATFHHTVHKSTPIALSPKGFPTIGKDSAPVEIVLIEDFRCRNCLKFSKMVIPKIQAEYIQKGKVRFTLVPVSFLRGSQAVANAALEVYRQNPDRFFPYLKAIFEYGEDLKTADLLRIARRFEGINLAQLQHCIETGCHDQELQRNLDWARDIMGLNFRTPALYINGAPGSTFSFEAIQYQINQILSPP